jgi:hypothetical protein
MALAQVLSNRLYRTRKIKTGNAARADTASEVPDYFKTGIGM